MKKCMHLFVAGFLISVILVSVTGCTEQKEKSIISQNTEHVMENTGVQVENPASIMYELDDSLKEKISVRLIDLPYPEHASIPSWVVDGNTVYYAVEFIDYLQDNEGTGERVETEQYFSKIMSYDTDSGRTDTVYQADHAIEITDLCFNGTTLIWEEYPRQENLSWQIKSISAGGMEKQAEVIIRDGDTEGELFDVIPSLVGQKVYWYDTADADNGNHPVILYSYDMESRSVSTEKDGLDLSSPYEQASVIDGWMCSYYKDSGEGSIYIENTDRGESCRCLFPQVLFIR